MLQKGNGFWSSFGPDMACVFLSHRDGSFSKFPTSGFICDLENIEKSWNSNEILFRGKVDFFSSSGKSAF